MSVEGKYIKRIETAFWTETAIGFAFYEVAKILAELEERIRNLEEK